MIEKDIRNLDRRICEEVSMVTKHMMNSDPKVYEEIGSDRKVREEMWKNLKKEGFSFAGAAEYKKLGGKRGLLTEITENNFPSEIRLIREYEFYPIGGDPCVYHAYCKD